LNLLFNMDPLSKIIDDALNLRETRSIGRFTTNVAAQRLKESDEHAFFAIKEHVESSELSRLLNKPGVNGVLQSLFFLGNKYCVDELCDLLEKWPPALVASLLGQGSLATQRVETAHPLIKLIEKMKQHPDASVRKMAERYEKHGMPDKMDPSGRLLDH
jgi:hypothetical protein